MRTALRTFSAAAGLVALLLAPSPSLAASRIIPVTSPGGIHAWLVQEPSIPMISVELAWRGGAALDPKGKEGQANMLSGLLDEGAGDLDSQAFQTRLEDLAISLRFDAGRDAFFGHLKTLSKNREQAFALLGMAVTAPRFDGEPVERIRRQLISGLMSDAEDADDIASRTWFAKAFPGHPYGRPVNGTVESVKAVTVDDLRDLAAARLARDNLVVAVVGDISPQELGALLDKSLGRLPAQARSYHVPEATVASKGSVTVIDRDIPQSVVMFGAPGIKRDDPDWYAAYVLNYILGGGGFTSRLMEEVREKRGLAYSVYSYLYPFDHGAVHIGGVATQNARVAESLNQIRQVMAALRNKGVTAKELADAKTYLNGSFPLRMSSNAGIAQLMISMQLERLGMDYLEKREALVNGVTQADIRRVATRLLDPDNLTVVVVGRPANITTGG